MVGRPESKHEKAPFGALQEVSVLEPGEGALRVRKNPFELHSLGSCNLGGNSGQNGELEGPKGLSSAFVSWPFNLFDTPNLISRNTPQGIPWGWEWKMWGPGLSTGLQVS